MPILLRNSIKVINLLFSKTSLYNYENLCRLDCLGIEENHVNSSDLLYDVFRIQSASKSLWGLLEDKSDVEGKSFPIQRQEIKEHRKIEQQNLMWDILISSGFRPMLLCGDIKKAFLQISIT